MPRAPHAFCRATPARSPALTARFPGSPAYCHANIHTATSPLWIFYQPSKTLLHSITQHSLVLFSAIGLEQSASRGSLRIGWHSNVGLYSSRRNSKMHSPAILRQRYSATFERRFALLKKLQIAMRLAWLKPIRLGNQLGIRFALLKTTETILLGDDAISKTIRLAIVYRCWRRFASLKILKAISLAKDSPR